MLTYITRRLLLMIPTLLGMTMVVFFVMALTPGGIGATLLNNEQGMRPAERQAMRAYYTERYGLNSPPYIQYLKWLNHVSPIGIKHVGQGFPGSWHFGIKEPDLGEAFTTHRPVSAMLTEAVPITILLECLSIPFTYGIAIWTGIIAAKWRGKAVDVGLGFSLLAMYSLPAIWVGVLMIGFLCNDQYIHAFPTNGLHDLLADSMTFLPNWIGGHFHCGYLLDMSWHLILPVICLSYGSIAYLSRLQRGSLLEALSQDYVRTARAKGVASRVILYRHAFRNSLMPLITVAANILPGLIGGAVIVEHIFGIHGMGQLGLDAVNARDRELLLAVTLFAGILQMLGNLLSDLAYAVADPRVSYVD